MNSELVSKISRVKYVWVVLTHQLGRSWPNLSKFLRCKEGGEFLYKQSSVQVCSGMPEFAVPYNQQKYSRAITLCAFVLCSTIMFNGKSNLQLSYTKMVKYRKWIMYFKVSLIEIPVFFSGLERLPSTPSFGSPWRLQRGPSRSPSPSDPQRNQRHAPNMPAAPGLHGSRKTV